MSAETYSAMEDAINTHFTDEVGALGIHWILTVGGVEGSDNSSHIMWITPRTQPVYVSQGLLTYTQERIALNLNRREEDTE